MPGLSNSTTYKLKNRNAIAKELGRGIDRQQKRKKKKKSAAESRIEALRKALFG
jgi:hypothetical protein